MRIFSRIFAKNRSFTPWKGKNVHPNDFFKSKTEILFEAYNIIYFPSHKEGKFSKNSLETSNFGRNWPILAVFTPEEIPFVKIQFFPEYCWFLLNAIIYNRGQNILERGRFLSKKNTTSISKSCSMKNFSIAVTKHLEVKISKLQYSRAWWRHRERNHSPFSTILTFLYTDWSCLQGVLAVITDFVPLSFYWGFSKSAFLKLRQNGRFFQKFCPGL